ncbi:MBL fold metallo-hydrolase [Halomonas salifodinae]|uniref:MBL fold metallo-hydrolase n=1 Tax=Halomonas salifodinae TaxID=438745 RepID=A0ABW2ESD9_9GAMM
MRFKGSLFAAAMALASTSAFAEAPLALSVYNADADSFHVNSVLVSGEQEALLIDTGFTRADALRIAAEVLDSGKTLTTIYISQADPDFYFGTELLGELFPEARLVAAPAVRERILANREAKLAYWGPRLGDNAPQATRLPEPLAGDTLSVEGRVLEVRGLDGELAHRPYVWVPSLEAIVGTIAVFGDLHVWTADTQQAGERQAWLAQLDEMEALAPAVVVPGHMQAGTPLTAENIAYTRDYLLAYERAAAEAEDSQALIDAMRAAYPEAGLEIALQIGAAVTLGEMEW